MSQQPQPETAYADAVQDTIEASGIDPERDSLPSASVDYEATIRDQLTENTGRHFLDSGGAAGRHWQENRRDAPWERPAWTVNDGYVTRELYNYMAEVFTRDDSAVALEAALYAFGTQSGRTSESWMSSAQDFAKAVVERQHRRDDLTDIGVAPEIAEAVLGLYGSNDSRRDRKPIFAENTYNMAEHPLSQDFIGVSFGGPYAEYVAVMVHNGADVRGGYTGPRVYKTFDGWMPQEVEYYCEACGSYHYSSCGAPEWVTFHRDENRVECDECGHDVRFA